MKNKNYDAIIIGFGKGGKTLAGILAGTGRSVALVEKSPDMYGGTCINVGCIPSKSLITSAKASAQLGGSFNDRAKRYASAVQERERVTTMLRKKNYEKLSQNPNITIYTAEAQFSGEKTVRLTLGDQTIQELEGGHIFINTGSTPFLPPIDGLKDSQYAYFSDGLMALKTLPEQLVILGGGYIGMEFASMYALFGSKVTVIQDGPDFLPREDSEIAEAVKDRLQKLGVTLLFSTNTKRVQDKNGQAVLEAEGPKGSLCLTADAILIAAGRRPNTKGLHPELAGVELSKRGGIITDEHLRTTADDIWAMGDVTGGLQFTYISLDDCRIVQSDLLGDGSRTTENRGAVPYSVFLDPPFSRVGLSEKEAMMQGRDIRILKLSAAAIPKAQVLRETDGLLKAIVDAKTGKILGAHLFCQESHEIINIVKLAMDQGLHYQALGNQIFTHPTMAESLNDLFHG